jgi:membrane-associated progesterone receptor component
MGESLPGRQLVDLAPATGGAIVAFVIVGALSFIIVQVYAAMTAVGEESPAAAAGGGSGSSSAPRPAAVPAGRPVRASELSVANGDEGSPIYLGVKDPFSTRVTVFDMSAAREFYGPGGPYHCFAARDATCGLAKSSLDPTVFDGDASRLTAAEQDTHLQWYTKYMEKYTVVGWLVPDGATGVGSATESFAPSASDKKNA